MQAVRATEAGTQLFHDACSSPEVAVVSITTVLTSATPYRHCTCTISSPETKTAALAAPGRASHMSQYRLYMQAGRQQGQFPLTRLDTALESSATTTASRWSRNVTT